MNEIHAPNSAQGSGRGNDGRDKFLAKVRAGARVVVGAFSIMGQRAFPPVLAGEEERLNYFLSLGVQEAEFAGELLFLLGKYPDPLDDPDQADNGHQGADVDLPPMWFRDP